MVYNNIISYNNQYGIYLSNGGLGLGEDYNLYWGNLVGYIDQYSACPHFQFP